MIGAYEHRSTNGMVQAFVKRLLTFGTDGLEPAQARQINVVTIVSIVVMLIMPIDIVLFWWFGIAMERELVMVPAVSAAACVLPLGLIAARRRRAAKVTLALLVNMQVLAFTYVHGTDTGIHQFLPAVALLSFFLFDRTERMLMALFALLPAALFLVAILHFAAPSGAVWMQPWVKQVLLVTNSLLMFGLTCFLVYVFHNRLERAEARIRQFSAAVSEYLDPQLVERLRNGASVAPAVRPVTVFFADLAGSTRLSMRMDSAAYGRMINEYVFEMEAIIKAGGAYIEDISGDGILGYVGSFDNLQPAEGASRVVDLALAMQHALDSLNIRFANIHGLPTPLSLRIGIDSGPVTVGKTDGVRAIYTANGEAVNVAAKLEDKVRNLQCGHGILIGEQTAALVRGRFEVEAHAMTIEGKATTAYEVHRRAGR